MSEREICLNILFPIMEEIINKLPLEKRRRLRDVIRKFYLDDQRALQGLIIAHIRQLHYYEERIK